MKDDHALDDIRAAYARKLPARLERIRELAKQGEPARHELIGALHLLGGSAGSFGFDEVSRAAQAWEVRLRRGESGGPGLLEMAVESAVSPASLAGQRPAAARHVLDDSR